MAPVRAGIDRLTGLVPAGRATAAEIGRTGGELASTFPLVGSPLNPRGHDRQMPGWATPSWASGRGIA